MTDADRQLSELLADPDFARIIELVAHEVMRRRRVDHDTAYRIVLSAIGEPKALAIIWHAAKAEGKLGLAKVIVWRRVQDTLDDGARPARQRPAMVSASDAVLDAAPGSLNRDLVDDPRLAAEYQQIINGVRMALTKFANLGDVQMRQASLIKQCALDGTSYPRLATELRCTEGALRVRLHKALQAFRRYIDRCHPTLRDLLGVPRRVAPR